MVLYFKPLNMPSILSGAAKSNKYKFKYLNESEPENMFFALPTLEVSK